MPTKMDREDKRRPSSRVALVCASIVGEYSRAWLSAPMDEMARREGVRPDRISRLKGRVIASMESLVSVASTRGRRRQEVRQTGREGVLESMLSVSAGLVRHVPLHRRDLQENLVQAFERVRGEHNVSSRFFCKMLGLKERTFRSWRARPVQEPRPREQTPDRPCKERHPGHEGRFSLFDLVPGVLAQADTTDIQLLGVPLKFIALQDPGNRERKLFEGYRLHTRENAEAVIEVVGDTLEPGTLLATDQGSPYMAEAARVAYEDLEIDHAPQREGTPTDKATLERAFGTVKQAMGPLFALSNKLAGLLPALQKPDLAIPLGKLLIAVFLKVWFMAAAPGPHPLEGASDTELKIIAERMREDARKEDRSKRLLLGDIHDAYMMEGSRERFIRAHYRHALTDIRESEQALRSRACRCQARCCDRYFAGILRNIAAKNARVRAVQREDQRKQERRKAEWMQFENDRTTLEQNPERMLFEGLAALSAAWFPQQQKLLFGGIGPPRAMITRAMSLLAQKDPIACRDRIGTVWKAWQQKHADFDPLGVHALQAVFANCLDRHENVRAAASLGSSTYAIFKGEMFNNRHSPPPNSLRF